jgi:MFS family permease
MMGMTHPYRRLLRDRDIRTLWAGLTISSIGSELYAFGAIWLAVSIAGADGGLIVTARFTIILVMSVAAGAFVDLLPRRTLLIGADVVRATFSLLVVAVALTDDLSLGLLAATAMALSAAGTIYQPALQSGLPLLSIDPERLRETNGLIDATTRIAQAIGPFLAAALVAILPVIHLLTLNAVSYLASAAAVLRIGHRFDEVTPPARQDIRKRLLRGLDAAHVCPGAWIILLTTGLRAGVVVLCCVVGIPLFFAQSPTGGVSAAAFVIGMSAASEILSNFLIVARPIGSPWRFIFLGYGTIGGGDGSGRLPGRRRQLDGRDPDAHLVRQPPGRRRLRCDPAPEADPGDDRRRGVDRTGRLGLRCGRHRRDHVSRRRASFGGGHIRHSIEDASTRSSRMSTPEPMNRAHVEAALERAGLRLSPKQVDELHRISGYVRDYLAELNVERPMSVEPALTFKMPVP